MDSVRLAPFGAGSGIVGLPSGFSPPSSFVRAAVLKALVRPLDTSTEAVFEAFRILVRFNITPCSHNRRSFLCKFPLSTACADGNSRAPQSVTRQP